MKVTFVKLLYKNVIGTKENTHTEQLIKNILGIHCKKQLLANAFLLEKKHTDFGNIFQFLSSYL